MAYAIGVAQPVSLLVETFGTEHGRPGEASSRPCATCSTCGPAPSSRDLDLRRPIYRKTAAYGHFGRSDPDFTWEQLSRLDDFKRLGRVGLVMPPSAQLSRRLGDAAASTRIVARVVPDVTGLDKQFDYLVPDALARGRCASGRWCASACRPPRRRLGGGGRPPDPDVPAASCGRSPRSPGAARRPS